MNSLFNPPFFTAFFQGRIATGAKMFFYNTETLDPIDIFDGEGTPLDNPISADLFGQFVPIYIGSDTGKYRVQLQTATGSVIDDVDPTDNILGELASSDGAGLLGFSQSETYPSGTLGDHSRRFVCVTDAPFLADATGAVDATTAINSALAIGGDIWFPAGTYKVSGTLDVAENSTHVIITGGATVSHQVAFQIAWNVTADYCSFSGGGTILSPAAWDGTNSRSTYGTIWFSGKYFSVSNLTLVNIPRVGVMFEDGINGRIINNAFIGNYPYASYTGTTTGQAAIEYNPPTSGGSTSATGNGSFLITGNRIETCIQGFLLGNYGSAAEECGIAITGNNFSRCWNHGVYLELAKGATVSGNNFTNCQYPMVIDGNGATVIGNSLYNYETTQSNGWCLIQVRQPVDCNISDNNLIGLGAAIYCDVISPTISTTIARNRISGNNIFRTGPNPTQTESAIRLGVGAFVCENNVISGNTISGVGTTFGDDEGAIELQMATGHRGFNNEIRGNTVIFNDDIPGTAERQIINIVRHDYVVVEDNDIIATGNATHAVPLDFINFEDCIDFRANDNDFFFTSGGTNIDARGIKVNTTFSGGQAWNNSFFFTSSGLASSHPVDYVGNICDLRSNFLDPTSPMKGSVTWSTGSSFDIPNGNCLSVSGASHDFVVASVLPTNANAGTLVATPGIYWEVTNGHLTLKTADASSVVGNHTFNWFLT